VNPKHNSGWGSVQKFGGTTKTGRHRSRQFLKNSVKNGENRENLAETHRRLQRNSEIRNTDKSASFIDKSANFLENRRAISRRFVPETG
jgi:hypothetical protein